MALRRLCHQVDQEIEAIEEQVHLAETRCVAAAHRGVAGAATWVGCPCQPPGQGFDGRDREHARAACSTCSPALASLTTHRPRAARGWLRGRPAGTQAARRGTARPCGPTLSSPGRRPGPLQRGPRSWWCGGGLAGVGGGSGAWGPDGPRPRRASSSGLLLRLERRQPRAQPLGEHRLAHAGGAAHQEAVGASGAHEEELSSKAPPGAAPSRRRGGARRPRLAPRDGRSLPHASRGSAPVRPGSVPTAAESARN